MFRFSLMPSLQVDNYYNQFIVAIEFSVMELLKLNETNEMAISTID